MRPFSATAEPDFEATGWSALATIGSPAPSTQAPSAAAATAQRPRALSPLALSVLVVPATSSAQPGSAPLADKRRP